MSANDDDKKISEITYSLGYIEKQMETAKRYTLAKKLKTTHSVVVGAIKTLQDVQATLEAEMKKDEDLECSCDDCQNHTCSTYGPLDGCRIVGSRDY